ncbi:hypothetical protein ACFV20_07100 [Streptomyces sp. NPDC059696]|uniref:hypothetical protein n=1 Tax=Streptomyces sp. NPDC059696 TaxID=3346911 RepID=UPI00368F03ED
MTVTADLAISLDGYMADPDNSLDNPGGDGVEAPFEWIHNLARPQERQGMTGEEENRNSELMREWFGATGVAIGRMM